jgi:hypothetical protein
VKVSGRISAMVIDAEMPGSAPPMMPHTRPASAAGTI